MSLVLGVYALGKHGWFFREGDAYTEPSAGTCAAESKPDAEDPAYIDIGAIEDWEDDVSGGQDVEVWRPSPGRLVLKDVLEIKPKFTAKFTTGEMGPLAVESFYRTSQKLDGSSVQFNPLSGRLRKGWFHSQLYSQDDVLISSMDLWGRLKCTGGIKSSDGSLVKPTWELLVLYSSLNTASL